MAKLHSIQRIVSKQSMKNCKTKYYKSCFDVYKLSTMGNVDNCSDRSPAFLSQWMNLWQWWIPPLTDAPKQSNGVIPISKCFHHLHSPSRTFLCENCPQEQSLSFCSFSGDKIISKEIKAFYQIVLTEIRSIALLRLKFLCVYNKDTGVDFFWAIHYQ